MCRGGRRCGRRLSTHSARSHVSRFDVRLARRQRVADGRAEARVRPRAWGRRARQRHRGPNGSHTIPNLASASRCVCRAGACAAPTWSTSGSSTVCAALLTPRRPTRAARRSPARGRGADPPARVLPAPPPPGACRGFGPRVAPRAEVAPAHNPLTRCAGLQPGRARHVPRPPTSPLPNPAVRDRVIARGSRRRPRPAQRLHVRTEQVAGQCGASVGPAGRRLNGGAPRLPSGVPWPPPRRAAVPWPWSGGRSRRGRPAVPGGAKTGVDDDRAAGSRGSRPSIAARSCGWLTKRPLTNSVTSRRVA